MSSQVLPETGPNEYQSEFLQQNPTLAEPVGRLLDLQSCYLTLNKQFQDEMWKLEQQHYARCKSLFQDRVAIVNGTGLGSLRSNTVVQSHGTFKCPAAGVPHFWLQAMKNNPCIAEWISPHDEPALSYLRDVRVEFLNENTSGFRILFDFDENPFFTNMTLTKDFIYEKETDQDDIYGELGYSKAPGCLISWRPGKDLTDIILSAPGTFHCSCKAIFLTLHLTILISR